VTVFVEMKINGILCGCDSLYKLYRHMNTYRPCYSTHTQHSDYYHSSLL